jgi:uncharacterized protein YodC (DUF2158 family)
MPVVEDKLIILLSGLNAKRLREVTLNLVRTTRTPHRGHPQLTPEVSANAVARRGGLEAVVSDVEKQGFVDCDWFSVDFERREAPAADRRRGPGLTRPRFLAAADQEHDECCRDNDRRPHDSQTYHTMPRSLEGQSAQPTQSRPHRWPTSPRQVLRLRAVPGSARVSPNAVIT